MFEDTRVEAFCDVVTLLVSQGAGEVDAQRFVVTAVKGQPQHQPTGFFELHGRGGLTRAAHRHTSLNVQGLEVLDLRTVRPDGKHWDFTRKHDRGWCMKLVREHQPRWIVAAPPCTAVLRPELCLEFLQGGRRGSAEADPRGLDPH